MKYISDAARKAILSIVSLTIYYAPIIYVAILRLSINVNTLGDLLLMWGLIGAVIICDVFIRILCYKHDDEGASFGWYRYGHYLAFMIGLWAAEHNNFMMQLCLTIILLLIVILKYKRGKTE